MSRYYEANLLKGLTTAQMATPLDAAREEARTFLDRRERELVAKARKRKEVAESAAGSSEEPRGPAEAEAAYRQTRAILVEIREAAEKSDLTDVLHRRLASAEGRMRRAVAREGAFDAGRDEYWRARTEWRFLVDLRKEWMAWRKTEGRGVSRT